MSIEKLREESMAKIIKANLWVALEERSGGLCEICYKAGPRNLHHILGRGKPKGFKRMPQEVWDAWPEVEFLCIMICRGIHGFGDRSGRIHGALRHNAPALLALILLRYGDRMWEGRTYREWLNEEPFRGWL